MANKCTKCGKGPQVGHTVSHSNIKTLRRFIPNIVKQRLFDPKLGKMVLQKLCTACLRTLTKVKNARVKKTGGKKATGHKAA